MNPKNFVIGSSKRLLIREAGTEDASFFFQLLNSPNWLTHIGDRGILTEQDAIAYIENSLLKSYAENGFGLWVMAANTDGKALGICGFLQRDYLDHPDIGFAILPEYEGKGLTTEAAQYLFNYFFEKYPRQVLLGITTESNLASQKILTSIGLVRDGFVQAPESKEKLLLFTSDPDDGLHAG